MGSDLKQQGESFHISMHCYLTEIKRIKKENRKMKKKREKCRGRNQISLYFWI